MTVTGAIFDCDGTLLDSMHAWRAVETDLANRAGIDLKNDEIENLGSMTIPEVGAYFHRHYKLGSSPLEVVGMIDEMMLENYRTKVYAREGALEFVKALHDLGVVCSVASSTPAALLQVGLTATGFPPYLSAIVSVDEAGASKREPAVYDLACAKMNTKKETTWVFEDSTYAIKTLLAAGYHNVAIYDDDASGTLEGLAIADVLIEEFTQLDAAAFVINPLSFQN